MATYRYAKIPAQGERIEYSGGTLRGPDDPVIAFIEADGTGPDVWRASVRVFDAGLERAHGGERKVAWMKVFAGEESFTAHNDCLLEETIDALEQFCVCIKRPLSTPCGGWPRAAQLIVRGSGNAIKSKRVTYDRARQMPRATEVSVSTFGDQVIRSMAA